MKHYYGIKVEGGLIITNGFTGDVPDIIDAGEIRCTDTCKIKGGYCIYIHFKGVEQPAAFPNLGEKEDDIKEYLSLINQAMTNARTKK